MRSGHPQLVWWAMPAPRRRPQLAAVTMMALLLFLAVFGPLGCDPRARTQPIDASAGGGEASGEAPAETEATVRAAPPEGPEEADEAPKVRAQVYLVPLKAFPDDLLDAVEDALVREYSVEVIRREPEPLPKAAYYPPRKRYKADRLLDHLDRLAFEWGVPEDAKVLGLTEVDISVTTDEYPDWGIYGYGRTPGQVAVVSSKRLKRKAKDRGHVRFRVATLAVHEIGHTFGLPHCDEHEQRCPMLDAEGGIENTDSSTGKLALGCRARLNRNAPMPK